MNRVVVKKLKKATLVLGISTLFISCNAVSDNNTTLEEKETKIPSFSDSNKEKIGCGKVENNKTECSKKTLLSSEDMILESLMKHYPIDNSIEIKEPKKENNSVSQALENLVDEAVPKEKVDAKKSLEVLVASANDSFDADDESIGRFDIEKFSSTWEELQSLVEKSEETERIQKNVKKDLELLVDTAIENKDIKKVEKNLNDLLTITVESPSVEKTKFANTVISDMSHKSIDLLEVNDKWIKIKIESGDTLSSYAEKYYGDPNKYKIIYEVNKDVIGKNYRIDVGSTLIIPTLKSIQGI